MRCNFCSEVLREASDHFLCPKCYDKIKFIGENGCIKCGKTLTFGYDEICPDCRRTKRCFDRAFSVAQYEGAVKSALIRYKFFGKKHIANTFVQIMLDNIPKMDDIDLVLSVPLHKERLKERGFNQSQNLAEALAQRLGIYSDNNIFIRAKNTKSQATLSREKRLKNLKGAFRVINMYEITNKNILLVDDIYTTGATVSECAKTLKIAGASKVYVLTVASGKGY